MSNIYFKELPSIGRQGCTKTHFGEQYIVIFNDGTAVNVYVWVAHGEHEKDNHDRAAFMAKSVYAWKPVKEVLYA